MSTITHDASFGRESADARVLTAADWGLFILRLALGVVFVMHGGQKMFGWFGGQGFGATVHGFTSQGIPAPLAYLVPLTEFFGGLGLVFGVLARLSALGIGIIMLVAIFKVHLANGFFMNWFGNQKGEGFEYHILAIAIALMILLGGPGRIALADWERRFLRRGEQ
jgi:putative oxidoreductase